MFESLQPFFVHWATLIAALWLSSFLFRGITFADKSSLIVAALMLGFVNTYVKPLLIFLTLPFTLITLGFFLLVLNALMIQLVSWLVRGFRVSGFWTAFFASIFISLCSLIAGYFLSGGDPGFQAPSPSGTWV
jgi:putative membrane protein